MGAKLMNLRNLTAAAALTALAALAAAAPSAAAPVPHPSPALTIVQPSGTQLELTSLKGKVVVAEFLLTNCPHCWRLAQMLSKLHQELGARGFQPVAIAFDNDVNGPLVSDFAARAHIAYPVGYVAAEKVDIYLGRKPAQRFQVPQLVVIDRAGTIRAQSLPAGEPNLESESYLRNLIDGLLKEEPAKR
jgi:peroxiredoxin